MNYRYYSAQEFQSLTTNNTFNVFHTNLDGLESKFDLLYNFINNLIETSRKLNQVFDTNITIGGYKQPFTTGSKFSKGGAALYTKDNINAFEREDLKNIDDG